MKTSPVDVVVRHPRITELGRSAREQGRVEAFARDLARFLVGWPAEELSVLVRVVTVVARKELHEASWLCRDRPLLAVEAAARATEALWPLLRGPLEPEPEEDEDEAPPTEGPSQSASDEAEEADGASPQEGEEAGTSPSAGTEGDSRGAASEESAAQAEAQPAPLDTDELMEQLAAVAHPDELDQLTELADKLQESLGAEQGALDEAAEAATDGALDAERVARHLDRFLPGVGWSHSAERVESTLVERLDDLVKLLHQLPGLSLLADRLGRMEESSRREGHNQGGREEVVGVTLGGDVANALPCELGLLGDPETEDLFFQRYLEHRLVSLELTGAGDQGVAEGDRRGPVIACIDTSASMEGAPEAAAKALILAVSRKVLPRGRHVHLILFGGRGEQEEIRLRRGSGGLEGLIRFLSRSFHSGTDFDGPLMRAMDLLEERDLRRADILVVTDGMCRATPDVVQRVLSVRQERGLRVWSVVLGRRETRGVAPFSDHVWQLDPSDAAGAAAVLGPISR